MGPASFRFDFERVSLSLSLSPDEPFSLNRHFPKNAESVGNVPATTPMGATMQGKTGIARKEHLSRPTSSFAYLARGEYRVIFVGRSNESQNRYSSSKEKLRGQGVAFGRASRPSANAAARCAPPINVICYPKAGAWQIVLRTYLPTCLRIPAAAIPPVIITSASLATASPTLVHQLPATFFLRKDTRVHKNTSVEGRTGEYGLLGKESCLKAKHALSALLHFFFPFLSLLNKRFEAVYKLLSIKPI